MTDPRPLVQGTLMGAAMKVMADGGPVNIIRVDQQAGDDGIYLPWFDLWMDSGAIIRVTFSDGEEPTGQIAMEDVEVRIKRDFHKVLHEHGIHHDIGDSDEADLVDGLAEAVMHHVERLVTT